jgi:hypothetical protein
MSGVPDILEPELANYIRQFEEAKTAGPRRGDRAGTGGWGDRAGSLSPRIHHQPDHSFHGAAPHVEGVRSSLAPAQAQSRG